jgi:predicted  nucleic acid-binding Zn-ribbon protein
MAVTAETLRLLHRIHKQLADLRERADRGPRQIKAREANLAKMNDELAKIQAEAKAAKLRVDQKQLLLKSGEDKIVNLEGKLNAAQSNREYQALKDQIAADKMANSVLADEILEGLEKLDEYKMVLNEAQSKINAAKDELTKAQNSVREQNQSLHADIKRLDSELLAAEQGLPDDFREVYIRIVRSRGADAMAEVEGEVCMGCSVRLTPNMSAEIKMGRAVTCKSCGRLIYSPEDRSVR